MATHRKCSILNRGDALACVYKDRNTQKALSIQTKQAPWSVVTVDVDQPGRGEILVRVESTALNPVDWKIQVYGIFVDEYPVTLGTDSAGVVVAVGEGVTKFAVGDRVLHQGSFTTRLATFKQYTIISADIAAKIPDGISFDQAASVPVGLTTATTGLYAKKGVRGGANLVAPWKGGRGKYANQPIVIFGGSSSVGQFVIQFAKLSGFSPIITTISPRNNDLVKSLGATHTIDRNLSGNEVVAAVKQITLGPIKIVFDAIAEDSTQNTAYDVLSPGGTLLIVLDSLIDKTKITSEKEIVGTFGTVHAEIHKDFGPELYSVISELLKSRDIKPNPVESVPTGLAGIPEGLERIMKNQVSGRKSIAHPQETA